MSLTPCGALRKRVEDSGSGPVSGFEEDLLLLKRYSRQLHEESAAAKDTLLNTLRVQNAMCQLTAQSAARELAYYQQELPNCLATPKFDALRLSEKMATSTPLAVEEEDAKEVMERKLSMVKQEIAARQELTREIAALCSSVERINGEVAKLHATLAQVPNKAKLVSSAISLIKTHLAAAVAVAVAPVSSSTDEREEGETVPTTTSPVIINKRQKLTE